MLKGNVEEVNLRATRKTWLVRCEHQCFSSDRKNTFYF